MGDERRRDGHRQGEQAMGGVRTGDRQPRPIPIPLPLGTGGEGVDGEGLLPGLPGVFAASLCQASLLKVAGLALVEAKRGLMGGSASGGWAAMLWLSMRAWSVAMRVARDSTRDP